MASPFLQLPTPHPDLSLLLCYSREKAILCLICANFALVYTPSVIYSLPYMFHSFITGSILMKYIYKSWSCYLLKQNKTLSCHFASCNYCPVLSSLRNQASRKSSLPGYTSSLLFLCPPCTLAILPIPNCKWPTEVTSELLHVKIVWFSAWI